MSVTIRPVIRIALIALVDALLLASTPARAAAADPRLTEADAALARGDSLTAYELYSDLLPDDPANDDLNFNLGLAAYAIGEYPHALLAFERILARHPDADRVRLELGRTHLAMGQDQKAREEFATVLAHNPPPNVRANIEALLSELARRDRRWTVSGLVAPSYFYDDNVNVGVGTDQVILNDVTYTLDATSLRKGDHGATLLGGVAAEYRCDEAGTWFAGGSALAYQKWHMNEEDQDLTYEKGSLLVRRTASRWQAGLTAKFENLDYDYRPLVEIAGFEPSFIYALSPRAQAKLAGAAERRWYQQETTKSGNYYALEPGVAFRPGPEWLGLTAGGMIFSEHTAEKKYDNHGWAASGGMTVTLPLRAQWTAETKYQMTQYHDPSTSAAGELHRRDRQVTVTTGLTAPLPTPLAAVTAALSFQYTDNNSNTSIHDYRRRITSFTLQYSF